MNYQYQEAIIKGVKDIIVDHYDSHQSVFDDFRNDEEFRKRVYEFISRGAIDICYCLMGGRHCHQCFIDGIISRHLTCINSLRLKDFLILMLQINERFKIKLMVFIEKIIKNMLTIGSKECGYCRVSISEWEDILKSMKTSIINANEKYFMIFERLRNDEWLREHIVTFMIRWGMSSLSCSILGHCRSSCFLGNIPSRMISGHDPIRRDELVLVLFHINAPFRRRIAEFMIRRGIGNCYCWNNMNNCMYSFINLNTFA